MQAMFMFNGKLSVSIVTKCLLAYLLNVLARV